MTQDEDALRRAICQSGKSMFDRGLTFGSSGNLSARLADGFLMTPTNSCLGFLDPDRLSRLDADGNHLSGDAPTKELPLHLALYAARHQAGGVVHLHSTYATALSCLADTDTADMIPPITAYMVMRVGRVPLLPYVQPGSPDIAPFIRAAASGHSAMLLANHGPVVSAVTFQDAVYAAEELEETAKLLFLTLGQNRRQIPPDGLARLRPIG